MAQSIILKRSSLPGKVPDTGSLNAGELAINTYDGKIFIKRAGNVDSIQNVLTTDSTTTGSITLTQTGSFGELVISQDANVQRDLYVIRDIITNNDIDAGGDISGSGLQVNDTLNVTHEYLTFTGSANLTGSVGVLGDLTVIGAVNAQQFNINVISSSVIYQSGSTKFGDTIDDTHQFTGSIDVSGSIIINGVEVGGSANSGSFTGSFTGSFIGDGSGLRGVVSDDLPIDGWDYDSNSSASINDFNVTSSKYIIDFEWDSQIGTPVGHKTFISNKSGSTQVVPTDSGVKFVVGNNVVATIDENGIQASSPAGTISGSSQLTSSYDTRYVLSGSITQTTWDNIASKPGGIVSGSEQIVGILSSLNSFSASNENTSLNTYTGSNEARWTSFFSYSSSTDNRLNNLESKSASVDILVSNINTYSASIKDAIQITGSSVTIMGNLQVYGTQSIINSTNLEIGDNIIYLSPSGAADIDLGIVGHYNDGTYRHGGIFRDASDGGTWKVFKGLEDETTGSVNTSGTGFELADFKAGAITGTSFNGIINATNGVVSGSSQVVGILSSLNSKTGSYATTGSNTFVGNQIISGGFDVNQKQNATSNFYFRNTDTTDTNSRTYFNIVAGSTSLSLLTLNGGDTYIAGTTGKDMYFQQNPGGTVNAVMTSTGVFRPGANGTQDLGSSSYRWGTIYTSDLSLNNGIGDWTIVEGEDDLFLYNNKKGKVYKFALTEVDPSVATPKMS